MVSKPLYFGHIFQNKNRPQTQKQLSNFAHTMAYICSVMLVFCLSYLSVGLSPGHCSADENPIDSGSQNKRQKRTPEEWHKEFNTILGKGIVEAQLDIQDRLRDPIKVDTIGRILYDYAKNTSLNIQKASQSSSPKSQDPATTLPFPFGSGGANEIQYTPESRQFTLRMYCFVGNEEEKDGEPEEHRITQTIILPDLSNPSDVDKFGKIVKAVELSALYGYRDAVTTLTIMRMMMNSNDEATKKSLETFSRYTYAKDGSITTALHNWIQTRQNFVRLFMNDAKDCQQKIIESFFRQFHRNGAWWSQVMHQHMLFTEHSLSFAEWTKLITGFQSLAKDIVTFTNQIFPWFDPNIEKKSVAAIKKQNADLQNFLEESAKELANALELEIDAAKLLQIQQRIADNAEQAKKATMLARPIDQWNHSDMDCFSDQERQDQHTCLLMANLHAFSQNLFLSAKLSIDNMKIADDLSTPEALLTQHRAQHDLWETLLDDTAFNENMIDAYKTMPELSKPWFEFIRSCFLNSIISGWQILSNPLMNTDRAGAPSDNAELEKRLRTKLTAAKSVGNNISFLYPLLNQTYVKQLNNLKTIPSSEENLIKIISLELDSMKSNIDQIIGLQYMLIGQKDEDDHLVKSGRGREFTNHFQKILTQKGEEFSASDKTLLKELDIVFPEVSSEK